MIVRVAVWFVLTTAAAGIGLGAVTYAGAARDRRRRPPSCPADDDERPPWPARVLGGIGRVTGEGVLTALGLLGLPLAFLPQRVAGAERAGTGRPVVLVYGPMARAASALWLARRLRHDGWRVAAVNPFGWPWGGVEGAASRLGAVVDRMRRESGTPAVDVVAHGRGGLVARACLRARGRGVGIARLLTLGTPHQGTDALPWLTFLPAVAELRPRTPLAARDDVPALADVTAIYSADDALVLPPGAGYYAGAFNVQVQGVGHLALLASAHVYDLVRENLAEADAPAGAAPAGRR